MAVPKILPQKRSTTRQRPWWHNRKPSVVHRGDDAIFPKWHGAGHKQPEITRTEDRRSIPIFFHCEWRFCFCKLGLIADQFPSPEVKVAVLWAISTKNDGYKVCDGHLSNPSLLPFAPLGFSFSHPVSQKHLTSVTSPC